MNDTTQPLRAYAIGDVHGHLDKLQTVHAFIDEDRKRTGDTACPVVHVGDYCDRGPNTRGVLDFLIAGQTAGAPWVCLLGNHDRMMRLFLQSPSQNDPVLQGGMTWLYPTLGGAETLRSYGVDPYGSEMDIADDARDRVPAAHRDFLQGLRPSYHLGSLFFCHAGVKPGVPLPDQAEDDLVWIREPFLFDERDHGALVIHGHTPVDDATHYGNRVNIDSGAAFGGALSAIVIEGEGVWRLTPSGREPLFPTGSSDGTSA